MKTESGDVNHDQLLPDARGKISRRAGFVMLTALGLLAGLLMTSGRATAQQAPERIVIETQHCRTPNGSPAAALVVNGGITVRLAKDQLGQPPMRAVSVVAALLTRIYRRTSLELTVRPGAGEGDYRLYLNNMLLLEATNAESKAWGVDPESLINTWRSDLEQALGIEAGSSAAVEGGASPEQNSGSVSTAVPGILKGGTLTLSGGSVRSLMHQRIAGAPQRLSVYAIPQDIRVEFSYEPQQLIAVVTGEAGPEEYRQAVDSALRSYLGLSGGDYLEWEIPGSGDRQIDGQGNLGGDILIAYSIEAEDSSRSSGSVRVRIQNRELPLPRESRTMFSNAPEAVTAPGVLYSAGLPGLESARLVYHHQNQGHTKLDFAVTLSNPGDSPVAVHVLNGGSDADINTFYVGYRAAENFWRNLISGTGSVLTIAPHSYQTFFRQELERGYTASGYFKLTSLYSTPVDVVVSTLMPGNHKVQVPGFLDESFYPVYASPYFTREQTYSPGDPWLYLRLGGSDPEARGEVVDGMYGYTHQFSVKLSNPNRYPELVFAVFRASGGEAKGQFYINGEYVSTPLIESGAEQLLAEIPLAPGQERELVIQAMALNGSYYPANIILRRTREP